MRLTARLVLAAALAVLVSLLGRSAAAQTMKIAVVDVQRAVMQTEDGLRAQATLKKLFDSRQQELNKRQQELGKQKEDIDKQAKVLSQAALQKKVDDWQKQMVELQTTFVEYNKELEKKQKEMTDPIFERVVGSIKRIAGTDGYDLIVDRATVAFSRSDLNLHRPRHPARERRVGERAGRRGEHGAQGPGGARRPGPLRQAVTWDGVVRLRGETLATLAGRHGGRIATGAGQQAPQRIVPVGLAREGDLAPLLAARFVKSAREAAERGAVLLVDVSLAGGVPAGAAAWVHEHATWAMAALLDEAVVPDAPAVVGPGCSIAPTAVLGPRVVLGARVTVGPGAVLGHPGFGWAFGAGGAVRPVPQLGGVVVDDDVSIGPLCTIDAGTLSPTRLRAGAKLDAHVHVGHNGDIGPGCIIAAQCGFAGSVTLGRGVLVGGQVGIGDHVTVGDGARIAGGSGVIGDVPPGAVVAGYPAVPRGRWLRAWASLYRGVRRARPEP